jgi:hypothetical protein
MRQEFLDPTGWLCWQSLEHVLNLTVRIVSVEPGSLDQTHYIGSALTGTQRAVGQPEGRGGRSQVMKAG